MRLERLSKSLVDAELDAYIITREPNIFYYTGSISGGVLLVAPDIRPLLLTSRLNMYVAQDNAQGCKVESYAKKDKEKKIVERLSQIAPETVGFDELSLGEHKALADNLGGVELKENPDLIWVMRRVKDASEQQLMKRAGQLSDIGMEAIREFIADGVREYEVAAAAANAMRMEGADDISFPFIVASGPRSAYPHAGVSKRKIRRGDFVTIDMGATYRRYCSDITRTFIVGSPSEKQRTIYETVLEAKESALPEIRASSKGIDVDRIARNIITKAGYGEDFIHGLGHGVGLEVHEPPSLSKRSSDTLTVGNVVSNEPGIYKKGFGGVRIEDTVLVTSSGPERLTKFDTSLDAMRV
ncbi:MAG: Xaa-Pro peptidase family protein [Candidatus Bathyarchaeia archaeon]